MNELSIFIDESGDFGEYSSISPYYIVALVIHHQEADISAQLQQLEKSLAEAGFPHHCIHAGPIIRRENEYAYENLPTRQGLLKKLHETRSADQAVSLPGLRIVLLKKRASLPEETMPFRYKSVLYFQCFSCERY